MVGNMIIRDEEYNASRWNKMRHGGDIMSQPKESTGVQTKRIGI